jgi:hypothetical protein
MLTLTGFTSIIKDLSEYLEKRKDALEQKDTDQLIDDRFLISEKNLESLYHCDSDSFAQRIIYQSSYDLVKKILAKNSLEQKDPTELDIESEYLNYHILMLLNLNKQELVRFVKRENGVDNIYLDDIYDLLIKFKDNISKQVSIEIEESIDLLKSLSTSLASKIFDQDQSTIKITPIHLNEFIEIINNKFNLRLELKDFTSQDEIAISQEITSDQPKKMQDDEFIEIELKQIRDRIETKISEKYPEFKFTKTSSDLLISNTEISADLDELDFIKQLDLKVSKNNVIPEKIDQLFDLLFPSEEENKEKKIRAGILFLEILYVFSPKNKIFFYKTLEQFFDKIDELYQKYHFSDEDGQDHLNEEDLISFYLSNNSLKDSKVEKILTQILLDYKKNYLSEEPSKYYEIFEQIYFNQDQSQIAVDRIIQDIDEKKLLDLIFESCKHRHEKIADFLLKKLSFDKLASRPDYLSSIINSALIYFIRYQYLDGVVKIKEKLKDPQFQRECNDLVDRPIQDIYFEFMMNEDNVYNHKPIQLAIESRNLEITKTLIDGLTPDQLYELMIDEESNIVDDLINSNCLEMLKLFFEKFDQDTKDNLINLSHFSVIFKDKKLESLKFLIGNLSDKKIIDLFSSQYIDNKIIFSYISNCDDDNADKILEKFHDHELYNILSKQDQTGSRHQHNIFQSFFQNVQDQHNPTCLHNIISLCRNTKIIKKIIEKFHDQDGKEKLVKLFSMTDDKNKHAIELTEPEKQSEILKLLLDKLSTQQIQVILDSQDKNKEKLISKLPSTVAIDIQEQIAIKKSKESESRVSRKRRRSDSDNPCDQAEVQGVERLDKRSARTDACLIQ